MAPDDQAGAGAKRLLVRDGHLNGCGGIHHVDPTQRQGRCPGEHGPIRQYESQRPAARGVIEVEAWGYVEIP